MPYFTEQARTYGKCMERIKAKYGEDVKVVWTKDVWKEGFLGLGGHKEIELTGIYGNTSMPKDHPMTPLNRTTVPLDRPAVPLDFETSKRQVLAAAGKTVPEVSMQAALKEIASLGETIRSLHEKVNSALPASPVQIMHPSLQKLEEDLLQNEFTSSFVKTIIDRVCREIPLHELGDYEELQKKVILWIGEKISVYREPESPEGNLGLSRPRREITESRGSSPVQGKKKPRIVVLIGPTGVGKTTTLVKLAALYGERERTEGIWQKQVRLITLDSYRIGAEYQLQKYGEIMDVPVHSANNYDGLKKLLALYRQDVDFILVDTIGKSPRDYSELGKMKAILDACPARTEQHLCIQASTKGGDFREILKQFEPFNYKSVIITKMDETSRVGNIISVLAEEGKSISFITTGQTVPWDIERATVDKLLINLEGFSVDRSTLAGHFQGV